MAKQRWRRTPDPGEKVPPKPGVSSKRRGRWQEKPDQVAKKSYRSPLKIFAGLFTLVIVLALIVFLILLLVPQAQPHLTILSATYDQSLLNPNAFAKDDAEALQACSVFDSRSDQSQPLTFDEFKNAVDDLSSIRPNHPWFGSQPTIAVVYVNAIGIALWQDGRAVPYLMPSNFEIPTRPKAPELSLIPVRNILDNFADGKAERKILFLDCQRIDSLWPLGVVGNEFVDAVRKQIQDLPDEKKKHLYVISSCSPGEITWVRRSASRSLFARSLLRALSGEADGKETSKDDYVSLGETLRFVMKEVRSDSGAFADVQSPVLLCGELEQADSVRLASVHPSWLSRWISQPAKPASEGVPRDDGEFLDQLQKGWEEYFTLAQSDPPPTRMTPLEWRFAEETLRYAEEFYRAGELDLAKHQLGTLTERLKDVRSPARSITIAPVAGSYSIPMHHFVGLFHPPTSDDSPGPSKSEPFSALVQNLIKGDITFQAAAKLMDDEMPGTKPIEAYLAMQFADPQLRAAEIDADEARNLVALRATAERNIFTGGFWTPAALPWFQVPADDADQGRRLLEDALLAKPSEAVPKSQIRIGKDPTPVPPERIQRDYGFVKERAEIIAKAYEARERALADLPMLIQFMTRRPWGDDWLKRSDGSVNQEENFQQQTGLLFDQILTQLSNLNGALLTDSATLEEPSDQAEDIVSVKIKQIRDATINLNKGRQELLDLLANEIGIYSKDGDQPSTELYWRRIQDLLLVPIPWDVQKPQVSAERRVNLLRRICQEPQQRGLESGERGTKDIGSSEEITPDQRRKRAERSAELAKRFFRIALGKRGDSLDVNWETVRDSVEMGSYVAKWWLQLRSLAVLSDSTDPTRASTAAAKAILDRSELLQAETALRLIEGYEAREDFEDHDDRLRRLDMARFLHWQAQRYMKDFWARRPQEDQHYFQKAANDFLDAADDIFPDYEAAGRRIRDQLEDLLLLADGGGAKKTLVNGGSASASVEQNPGDATGMTLTVDPKEVAFRLSSKQNVRIGITGTNWQSLPPGFGALLHEKTPENTGLEWDNPKVSMEERSEDVTLKRQRSATGKVEFDTILRYRGHRRNLPLPIDLSDGSAGPGIVYDGITNRNAQYSVRHTGKQGTKLLFVLDCSASMNKPQSNPRINILKKVMEEFGDIAEANQIEVGIRLFGANVNADLSTDTELILPIGPFDRVTFDSKVRTIRRATEDPDASGGLTPLFYSLAQVLKQNDFKNSSGDLEIILISDGVDSTTYLQQKGQKVTDPYSRERLLGEYKQSDLPIHIHTIGFQLDDPKAIEDLKTISDTTGGKSVSANNADELREHIRSLGSYDYAAIKIVDKRAVGEQIPKTKEPLTSRAKPWDLTDFGLYEVQVLGNRGLRAQRTINVHRGDKHDLIYKSGELTYDESSLEDGKKMGSGLGTTQLYLFSAARNSDGSADFEFALHDAQKPLFDPGDVHVSFAAKGAVARSEVCHLLEPNVPGYHYPRWKVKIEDWPKSANRATMKIAWGQPSEPVVVDLKKFQQEEIQAVDDVVDIGGFEKLGSNPQFGGGYEFHIKLDLKDIPDKMQPYWYIDPGNSILHARQVYNLATGIHKSEFVVFGGEGDLEHVRVYFFNPDASHVQSIEAAIDLER